jgi:putative transposase
MRKEKLVNGKVYHILNKSIAGFEIFKDGMHCSRIIKVIRYYQKEKPLVRFSDFIKTDKTKQNKYPAKVFSPSRESLVEIIAYCIMPTHFHLILKQLKDRGISIFMNNIQNSYTRYFNIRHKRKGPLWQGRFKNVLVDNDEYLLHLTRYIHLNPVTAIKNEITDNCVISEKEHLKFPVVNKLFYQIIQLPIYDRLTQKDIIFISNKMKKSLSCLRR